ncbi:MAG: esterase, depolymerase family protein [Achromobacter mucicolens]|jgi:poly(hydroxyalkanoate) depolymerase family esterase|uniref:extracellular catalytic domain type 1 short-chain-length polyhydroxyalkanoate depolymerase n=1 Tax=Achromobacter mucicolens TaxID=1389922 RepID=UPI00243247EB|nr:PHB depolymerase family esterase [Achromobacter mucicolens]MDF2860469.1 esterase, depolymerase family protein [Achromobacter mucicolens]
MARSFSSLFFKAAKKITRLQRAAMRLAAPKPARKRAAPARKKAADVTTGRAAKAARPAGAAGAGRAAAAETAPLGAGRWEALRQFSDKTGRRLAFSRYTPATAPPAGMPLVVMLHGCRQTSVAFARGSRMNQWADAGGFMVLYPQQSLARQVQRCWRWFQPDDDHGGAEADLIAALIRSEVARHGVDPERIYVAGLSAGAGMAALVALRHPRLIAAVAMHSGPVVGDAHNAGHGLGTMRRGSIKPLAPLLESVSDPAVFELGMPALILHGQLDPAVAPRNAKQLFEQFRTLNAADPHALPVERVLGLGTEKAYRRVDVLRGRKTVLRLCEITRLEHAWSGGDPSIRYHARSGPDASALVWRFFQGQRRTGAIAGAQ